MNVHSIFLLSAVSLVSACATPSKDLEQAQLPVEATVVWGNHGRGGAAERVPGYVHALHRGGAVHRDEPAPPEPQPSQVVFAATGAPLPSTPPVPAVRAVAPFPHDEPLPPQTLAAIAAVTATDAKPEPIRVAGATESVDDKRRRAWEKYCDGAHAMNDEEWQLLREAGIPDNVPADLAGHCVHPK